MGIWDYIRGRRIELVSALPRDEIARRINAATPSLFNPFASGVSGNCRAGFLSLRWSIPLFSNGFAPVFSGRLSNELGRTRISARWGASRYLQIFLLIWYGLVAVFLASLVQSFGTGRAGLEDTPMIAFAVMLVAFLPLLFHLIFNRSAEAHLASILQFLACEAQACEDTAFA